MSHFAREMETGAARAFGCIWAVAFLIAAAWILAAFIVDPVKPGPTPSFESDAWERPAPPQEVIQRPDDPPPALPAFWPKNAITEPKAKPGPKPRTPVVIAPRDGTTAKSP